MIALCYIHILACFLSVFVSSEDQGSYYEIGGDRPTNLYPTKSIRVDFPGQSCGQEFVIEGAELNSSLDALHAYDQCELSFSPVRINYKYRKLVMKFTHYDITNCNVSVDVYNYRNSTRFRPIHSLGCLDTPPPSWHEFNDITLVLRNRYHAVSGYDFRIVITAFSELGKKASCPGFNCENHKCISRSLLCDGVVNCFDELDKDEKWCYANGTYFGGAWDETTYSSRWTLAFYAVVGIPIAIGVIAYYAYRKFRRSGSQAVVVQQREQAGLLVATAPSGNVITLQQPIYVPGVNQPSQQLAPTYAGTTYPNI